MGWAMVVASIFFSCLMGFAVVRRFEQKHPSNGKDIAHNLEQRSSISTSENPGD